MATVLMPIPARDFDPTEVAIPWAVLTGRGHTVVFATPDGAPGAADAIMLDGIGLDPWGTIPLVKHLRVMGLLLRANGDARWAYRALAQDRAFRQPIAWDRLRADDYDGLVLPGGHRARGMRAYLESSVLQRLTAAFFAADKPVGAICHGVVLAARSTDDTGRSVLEGRGATALTWAQERAADRIARVGRWWDPSYYRTYAEASGAAEGYMSVEQEVTRALGPQGQFADVPDDVPDRARKTSGLHRDSATDARPAWVVTDGNLVTARWPGDAHTFAAAFADKLARTR